MRRSGSNELFSKSERATGAVVLQSGQRDKTRTLPARTSGIDEARRPPKLETVRT